MTSKEILTSPFFIAANRSSRIFSADSDVLRFQGCDIQPFTRFEAQAGQLIEYKPNNRIHGQVLYPNEYKYSKFAESVRAVEYLKKVESDAILSYLAYRTGLLPNLRLYMLKQIVSLANFKSFDGWNHIIVDENQMLDICSKLK